MRDECVCIAKSHFSARGFWRESFLFLQVVPRVGKIWYRGSALELFLRGLRFFLLGFAIGLALGVDDSRKWPECHWKGHYFCMYGPPRRFHMTKELIWDGTRCQSFRISVDGGVAAAERVMKNSLAPSIYFAFVLLMEWFLVTHEIVDSRTNHIVRQRWESKMFKNKVNIKLTVKILMCHTMLIQALFQFQSKQKRVNSSLCISNECTKSLRRISPKFCGQRWTWCV